MSSFIRRIERTQHESKKCHKYEVRDPETGLPTGEVVWYSNPSRNVHYKHRGSKLGFHNPEAKDLLARQAREAARAAVS